MSAVPALPWILFQLPACALRTLSLATWHHEQDQRYNNICFADISPACTIVYCYFTHLVAFNFLLFCVYTVKLSCSSSFVHLTGSLLLGGGVAVCNAGLLKWLGPSLFSHKAMAPHSSTLAWKIPWMEEPGRLQSMGSLRVGHDWATSLSLFTFHFHALEKEMATRKNHSLD